MASIDYLFKPKVTLLCSRVPLPATRRGRLILWAEMLVKDSGWTRSFFNTRTQIAPDVYRSSHPLPYQVGTAARLGIRTIVNLRSMSHHHGSYALEREACARHGIQLLQFRLPSRDIPQPEQVMDFARLVQDMEFPVLFHCKSGADRAGLACALTLMLRHRQPPEIALRQLSLCFYHLSHGKTGILDHFIKGYAEHRSRHATGLLEWSQRHYDLDVMREQFRSRWWGRLITDRILRRE